MALGTLLARHARYRPHHTALVCDDERLDFATFDARVQRAARALASLGIGPGDAVATLLRNRVELLELYWAAARMGFVIVPLSPLLRGTALRTLLEDADAAVLVTETAYADAVEEVRAQLPGLPREMYVLVDHDGRTGFADYRTLAQFADPLPASPSIDRDAPYNIIYSSGTTGLPKGIVHSHQVRWAYCTSFASAFRMTPESVALHAGSIVFNGAFLTLMPAMYLGATFVLQRQFSPETFLEAVRRERVTHVVLVPSQIVALLHCPAFSAEALQSLEMLCSVGAPLHRVHKVAIEAALPGRFYELYGLTEGFVTVLDPHDAGRKLPSVGTPPPGFELRIEREDRSPCAVGEVGEIVGRGPILMSGYHKRADLTRETIVDGWLKTGDLGYVDDDGFLHLVDRKKDLVISGGVNVFPRDIEEVILRHPAVREAVVFGVPDERWGEALVAAVRVHHAHVEPEALRRFVNERVGAKYQRLLDLIVLDELPRNTTGKVLKRVIRESYLQAGTKTDGVGAFVESRGLRLHYLRGGKGKTPLVLLHGLTANAHFFAGLMRAGLGDRFDVIRPDLRGRGLSDKPPTGYAIADHGADVLALLDALGIESAVIGGHSFGGLVTLWLAAHHPERVRRQLLLDIAGPTIHNPAVMTLIQPSLERLGRQVASLDEYLAQMRALPFVEGHWSEDLERYFRADVEIRQDGTVTPRAAAAAIEQVIAEARREDWPALIAVARAAALVIHAEGPFGPRGTSPIVTREQALDLVAALPSARYVEVPGNHMTMASGAAARAAVTAIETFVDETENAARADAIETRAV